jgi:hypothetical protein
LVLVYEGERYQLQDFLCPEQPPSQKEQFNQVHLSLCNVIERVIGV